MASNGDRPAHHVVHPITGTLTFRNPWPSASAPTATELLFGGAWLGWPKLHLDRHPKARELQVLDPEDWGRKKVKELKREAESQGKGNKVGFARGTWLGHATVYVQLPLDVPADPLSALKRKSAKGEADESKVRRGRNEKIEGAVDEEDQYAEDEETTLKLLFDPIFSERAGPTSYTGPGRIRPTPCKVEDLPGVDAVLISHNQCVHVHRNGPQLYSDGSLYQLRPPRPQQRQGRPGEVAPRQVLRPSRCGDYFCYLLVMCSPVRTDRQQAMVLRERHPPLANLRVRLVGRRRPDTLRLRPSPAPFACRERAVVGLWRCAEWQDEPVYVNVCAEGEGADTGDLRAGPAQLGCLATSPAPVKRDRTDVRCRAGRSPADQGSTLWCGWVVEHLLESDAPNPPFLGRNGTNASSVTMSTESFVSAPDPDEVGAFMGAPSTLVEEPEEEGQGNYAVDEASDGEAETTAPSGLKPRVQLVPPSDPNSLGLTPVTSKSSTSASGTSDSTGVSTSSTSLSASQSSTPGDISPARRGSMTQLPQRSSSFSQTLRRRLSSASRSNDGTERPLSRTPSFSAPPLSRSSSLRLVRDRQREREATSASTSGASSPGDGDNGSCHSSLRDESAAAKTPKEEEEERRLRAEEKAREVAAKAERAKKEAGRAVHEGRWTKRILRKGAIYHAGYVSLVLAFALRRLLLSERAGRAWVSELTMLS